MARRRRKIDYKKQITDSDIKAVSEAYNRKKDDCINELSKKTDRFFKNAQFERGQFYDAESYINYCNEASRRLLATINENVLTGKGLRTFIYEQTIRSSRVQSGLSIRHSTASMVSPRLWGGTFVAMPTAMPTDPFTKRFGKREGSTTGSFSLSS